MPYRKALSVVAVVLLIFTGFAVVLGETQHPTQSSAVKVPDRLSIAPDASGVILSRTNQTGDVSPSESIGVLVTLGFSNQSLLNWTLDQLQNPFSSMYHKFLSKNQFISEFSPSTKEYDSYVNYFLSRGLNVSSTYSDRLSIALSANVSTFESVFNTNLVYFSSNGSEFYAPNTTLSLDVNYGTITGVAGLSDRFKASLSPMFSGSGSSQLLYGSDLQSGYQLNRLYNQTGYPTGETIATILWCGQSVYGTTVAPFVPSDVTNYLNATLPAGEPRSAVYGYPVGNAPLPGPSAQNDSTQVNIESTLDLEMAGSTAPGATLVEVYAAQAYTVNLDEAFADILNPLYNTTVDGALSNVVAISNSWGSSDTTDAAWVTYEQEAAARGITLLASSGDSGNSNGPSPSYPATSAFDSYGTIAVGGTQTIMSGTQSTNGTGTTGISSQAVWYNTPNTGDGSQGGVSSIYPEPGWQANSSDANSVIAGNSSKTGVSSGRATPDIAGVGANMEIYITSFGISGYATLWGTSVASPLLAGEIATMDSYLGAPEGFMDPLIYKLGQEQYQRAYAGPSPFYFVYNGSNGNFSSAPGYNLVDGWGSINAYNFVMAQQNSYNVTFNAAGLPPGATWQVDLSNGFSLNTTATNFTIILPNGTYSYAALDMGNYSYALNGSFTVAGSPLTVQCAFNSQLYNVQFIESGLPSGIWYVNESLQHESATSGSPVTLENFNGTYHFTVQTGNRNYMPNVTSGYFTVSGENITVFIKFIPFNYTVIFSETGLPTATPWYANVTGKISSGPILASSYTDELMNGSYTYTIGTVDKTYNATGGAFTINGNSPSIQVKFEKVDYQVTARESGLPPGTMWFLNLTDGQSFSATGSTLTTGLSNGTYTYSLGTTDKEYNASGGSFTVSGADESLSLTFTPVTYAVTFAETGLPSGTSWFVNITGEPSSGKITSSSYSVSLSNGTYAYTIGTVNKSFESPAGTIVVNGDPLGKPVIFSPVNYTVTFSEQGLLQHVGWSIDFNGTLYSSSNSSISVQTSNGTYSYSVSKLSDYRNAQSTGFVRVDGANQNVTVIFIPVNYTVTFVQTSLPSNTVWSVVFNGIKNSSSSNTIAFFIQNGTYNFDTQNTSLYYVHGNSTGELNVNGKTVQQTVQYLKYASILVNVTPGSLSLSLNGKVYNIGNNGSADLKISAGNYSVVIEKSGYHTYYSNLTATPGGIYYLNLTLKEYPIVNPGGKEIPYVGNDYGYILGGAAAVAVVAGLGIYLIRKRR